MGFLDSLGDAAKTLGKAVIAGPGAVYDIATYVAPGDQWGSGDDDGFGGMLNNVSGRGLDLLAPAALPFGGDRGTVADAGKALMDGAYKVYHEAVDQPVSSLFVMLSHMDPSDKWGDENFGALFSGEAWSRAYSIAEDQSLGQSMVDAFSSQEDPFARADEGTPFQNNPWVQEHPTIANLAAISADIIVTWNLDPFVVAGKGAKVVRSKHMMARVKDTDKGQIMSRLDGSVGALEKSGFPLSRPDFQQRFDDYVAYIAGNSKLGRPLNAAEIRYISPELRESAGGQAISSALADAVKIEDEAKRLDAARRVIAVSIGDTTQIARLRAEVPEQAALADKLDNIVQQRTLRLQEQALNDFRTNSPEFRAAFNQQLDNLDQFDDLSDFIRGWRKQVDDKMSLLDTAGRLDAVPGVHGRLTGNTAGKLNATQGKSVLQRVEKAHDAVVDKITRLPKADSYSTVYQQGLHSLPLLVAAPVRWTAATLPTKAVPAIVRGLSQTHFTGFVDIHDWDGGATQLDSMMRIAGVDDQTRLTELSNAYKARTEVDKMRAIERVEHVAMNGVARRMSEKHGINIDSDFIKAAMEYGQGRRGLSLASAKGSRIYAATKQTPDAAQDTIESMAFRQTRGIEDALERERMMAKRTDELSDFKPRVDMIVDESGTPLALPVVSSQLANRVPLMDVNLVNQMVSDKALVERLGVHAEAWKDASLEMRGLQRRLAQATGSQYTRLQKQVNNVRKKQDALLSAASAMNRWWKVSVLFRLGYPMRVLADDHMRIAARIGYMPFLKANVGEAVNNSFYNHMPAWAFKGGRAGEASKAWTAAQGQRKHLYDSLGRDTLPKPEEWDELAELRKVYFDGVSAPEAKTAAYNRIREIDPDGKALEFYDLTEQVKRANRAIAQHERNIAKYEAAGDKAKVAQSQKKLAERVGERDIVLEQLAGRQDPADIAKEIGRIETLLKEGPKAFRGGKRHIGQRGVKLDKDTWAAPAFDSSAHSYYTATSSNASFNYQITDGEQSALFSLSSGHWRTVQPGEPGYYQLWANILNHQVQHSPEFMAIVKGKVDSPQAFAKWLRKPENKHLRDRMRHYAQDPEDWGGRLISILDDYVPSQELLAHVQQGRVTARQLQKLFPEGDGRLPALHGQLADVQSGRATATRAFSSAVGNAFRYLAEVPTDRLSRHPFFNAIYQREVKAAYNAQKVSKAGGKFTAEDLNHIEKVAREKSLAELKRTLWDVSAHSHGAHVMRFLSPFFAAHQEALIRWWNIAKDDPSVVRRFQLAFDVPRHHGLVYSQDTGEIVQPGEGIGPGHSILMKIPFADDDNAINRWLLKMGGGNYWHVNENGFNLILQSGIANPGTGPMVTVPLESLVQHYADEVELEKAARVLNQYPPAGDSAGEIAIGNIQPAWSKRFWAAYQGKGNAEFERTFMQNASDSIVTFELQHGRVPNDAELDAIMDKAKKRATLDLLLMGATNAFWATPAKPNSKYAAVQNGLQRLYEQMRTEGHDMDWLRENFIAQYGEPYMAMIYSMGSNPAKLDANKAEVDAIKKHRTLLQSVDPALTRMVIGPDVAGTDDEMQMYSAAASSWLKAQDAGKGATYRGSKDGEQVATQLVVNQGWRQYDELTNYLDVQAAQMGLSSYEDSPQLVEAKRQGLAYLKQTNPVFAHAYDSWTRESFDKKVDDMRQIASNKSLLNDPMRQDIYWLGQYIMLRDMVTQTLAERAAAGGARTIGAQANADLATAFRSGVAFINQQSPWFKDYAYHGVIEKDPYLLGEEIAE